MITWWDISDILVCSWYIHHYACSTDETFVQQILKLTFQNLAMIMFPLQLVVNRWRTDDISWFIIMLRFLSTVTYVDEIWLRSGNIRIYQLYIHTSLWLYIHDNNTICDTICICCVPTTKKKFLIFMKLYF